jgi:hypothetical protein
VSLRFQTVLTRTTFRLWCVNSKRRSKLPAIEAVYSAVGFDGAMSIQLHATQKAVPMYARMNCTIASEYTVLRVCRDSLRSDHTPSIRPGKPEDIPSILALDREATGADRSKLLLRIWPIRHLSIPVQNSVAQAALRSLGFVEVNRATKMRLGPPVRWEPRHIFSVFNLYWG